MGIQWVDSFVNLLAGMGVAGRDKFASQSYSFVPMTQFDLECAYRGDWIARKVVDIPAFDMTRQWREWQADEAQVELIEECEKDLFVQQKVQQALIKSRLYGGAIMIMGVDNGAPEEELAPESVGKDSLKFLHVVAMINVAVGPLDADVTSPYYGLPTWYEVRSGPQGSLTQQVQLHPSRVVRFIGSPLPDPMTSGAQWGDSVLQSLNDAVKMCGLVTGSLATLISELKIDIIKIPDMTEIVSTPEGTQKLQTRFATANAMKSVINTVVMDSTEEWQRVQANLAGVPEILTTYLQIASGAADIPAGRFLGLPHRGLNVSGEADFRNYYDKLAGEQSTVLTPAMSVLDEVIIRSALGSRPPEIYYEWNSLWQLSDGDKADIALKKAQAYQIDVNAAQIPPVALANGRVNQLIEDGTYPGLQNALEDAAAEGDTIEEQNAPQPMPVMQPGVDPVTGEPTDPNAPQPQPPAPKGNGGTPPFGKTLPGKIGAGDAVLPFVGDENECHDPNTGEFCGEGGGTGGSDLETAAKPPSPHGPDDYDHVGRADLAAQGFKPKGRGGSSKHEAALVAWYTAKRDGKPATAVIGGRGWTILRSGDKVPFKTPHMVVTPKGILHAYNPKKIGGDSAAPPFVGDENECHNPPGAEGGQFCSEPGAGGAASESDKSEKPGTTGLTAEDREKHSFMNAPEKDKKDLRKYFETSNAFEVNKSLRGQDDKFKNDADRKKAEKDGKDFTRAFEKNAKPLDHDAILYRGVSGDTFKDMKVGHTFEDKGVVSTSGDKTWAKSFAKDGGTLIEVGVPKGTKVMGGPSWSNEQELALGPGTKFRVTHRSKGRMRIEVMS